MSKDFLPRSDAQLVAWGQNLVNHVGPNFAAYSITAEQAGELQVAFGDYQNAYHLTQDPQTRSTSNFETKRARRAEFVTLVRHLVGVIQSQPTTTNQQRVDLRITVRNTPPTPVPTPQDAPLLTIASVRGRLFNVRLTDASTGRRRKPFGARQVWLYTYVGEAMPTFEQMEFYGSASKTTTQVVVGNQVAVGAKVWVSACWVTATGKSGPVSLPVFGWTNHGMLEAAA